VNQLRQKLKEKKIIKKKIIIYRNIRKLKLTKRMKAIDNHKINNKANKKMKKMKKKVKKKVMMNKSNKKE
jgi:hypothetical protein